MPVLFSVGGGGIAGVIACQQDVASIPVVAPALQPDVPQPAEEAPVSHCFKNLKAIG